jgi:cytochrome P450
MYEYERSAEQEKAAERAAAEFVAYLRELAALRRQAPQEDLITDLVQARNDQDQLTEDELVTTCILLLNAGHEATVNVTGNGTLALLRHPGVLAWLRTNPAGVPAAIEELIRYDAPLQLFERTATQDIEIGGVTVRSGEKIAALLGAANRDPAVFANPDALDVRRRNNPHVGFGAGIHFCIGAPLARIELQASFITLLTRFGGLALAGEPRRRGGFVIRGLAELPVTVFAK